MRIETPRLVLRRIEPGDVEAFVELYADAEVTRFLGGVRDRPEVAGWLEERVRLHERQGFGMCTAVEKDTERIVGRCGLVIWEVEGAHELEVGYALLRRFWGVGYATEAAIAVRDFALQELGRGRLVSLIDELNHRSIRVADKLGMSYERAVAFRGKVVRLYAVNQGPS